MIWILEYVLLPENRVFCITFVSQSPDHSDIHIRGVLQHVLLQVQEHILLPETLRAKILFNHDLKYINETFMRHLWDMEGQNTNDFLEEVSLVKPLITFKIEETR